MGVGALNLVSLLLFVLAFALISVLILAAPRRPRLPQVFFLVLASFLLVNKVWSPQYVIWLVPLVVLARPRLWSYLLWQVAEVGYFFAIWAYLITQVAAASPAGTPVPPGGIGGGLYFAAAAGPVRHGGAAVPAGRQGHPAAGYRHRPGRRRGRPGGRRPHRRPGRGHAAPHHPPALGISGPCPKLSEADSSFASLSAAWQA